MRRGLIVSCQALPEEPLHSSFIMGRMAVAAKQAGAVGIRANGIADIEEIKSQVALPIIAIIKKEYPHLTPYITPTMAEVDALVQLNVDIIAMDATISQDKNYLKKVRKKYPKQRFMADISTFEEGMQADELGFDFIGTTLIGYTKQSAKLEKFDVLKKLVAHCNSLVIAEGNFNTPEQAARAIELGAYCVVVGSSITRPQVIAKRFTNRIGSVL